MTDALPDTPTPVLRSVLVDDVYERLKAWIIDQIHEPGVRVNIDAAARSLAVSPTPVREALVRLESDGFVVKVPSKGYSVTPPLRPPEVDELFEFRGLVEPWAAERAASRIDDEGRRRLAAEMATVDAAPAGRAYEDFRELVEHDMRLHDLILELGGNETVRTAHARTHCHLHLFRLGYGEPMGTDALSEHARIVAAVSAGDTAAAGAAMRQHLDSSHARIVAARAR